VANFVGATNGSNKVEIIKWLVMMNLD
jgi:hypothetical protein